MDKKNKNPNVPNLRFPGYDDEWASNALDKICTIRSGIGFKANEYVSNGIRLLKIDNIGYGKIKWDNISYLPAHYKDEYIDLNLSEKDIVLALNRPITNNKLKIARLNAEDLPAILYQRVGKINVYSNYDFNFIYYALSNNIFNFVLKTSIGSDQPFISTEKLKTMTVCYPNFELQKKIGNFLNMLDKRIETQIKIIDDLKSQKKIISGEIFKSVNRKPNGLIRDFINYEQPTKYIVKSTDYVDKCESSIPVLTANQAFILGYTNDTEGIYNFGECIIFDDFTMDLKYVDFPFKIKSSAIKILTPKNNVNIKYIYEYLKYLNLSSQEHKRHYISEVEVLDVFIPAIEIQNDKLQIINTFNEKIENEKAILKSYMKEKNYLLSNLFI